jgi:hypothetical protein
MCVAIVIQLVGCRPRIAQNSLPATDPLDARFPDPDPESWEASAPPPGLQSATCQLTTEETDSVLLSFLYGVARATEQLESISLKKFSVEACYRAEFQFKAGGGTLRPPVVIAIIGDTVADSLKQPVNTVVAHLVYFVGTWWKQFEVSYSGGYDPQYSLFAISAAGESNPLVLVRRNEGANSRNIIYQLYRVESDRLRLLWEWSKDLIGRSTTMYFSISNIDFSEIRSNDPKRFTVYTTYGNLRKMDPKDDTDLTPKHRVTSFEWNAIADAFVEESSTNR